MRTLQLLFPELLLLAVPLLWLYLSRARVPASAGAVRLLLLAFLVLLAAVPIAPLGGRGVDVVVIADLSRSMPDGNQDRMVEIIKLLEARREEGDRVGIVTYGREARIERLPEEFSAAGPFLQEIDADGSDLGAAISLAASLIPRERPGRLLVISDGEANGAPAVAAAHEAAARGLPIDYRAFSRSTTADVAVEWLDLPGVVDEREPFQFSAWVRTDRSVETEAVLLRDDVVIARQKQTFQPGATQLTFRDAILQQGVARYRLQLSAENDRVPENNVGSGAVRVDAPAAILVVNSTGQPDNLSRALEAGRMNVKTVTPSQLPRDLPGLVSYRAVILENVPAGKVGPQALIALSRFALDLGGGLLLTGGGGSFGVGGYFKSDLDPHLPVSMEIKDEHRKLSLAMLVALDRSGSMAAPVGGGQTKMDLANLGTCAAIDTLGPFDEVGVIAVDSQAHVVTPLGPATDTDGICGQVRSIRSMGGGIFTFTALLSASRMLHLSDKGTRHIVLFADAADAEEPGEYENLLDALSEVGITVSVIGLGSENDPDADFLKDVAERGGGRIQFTTNVEELPRLFAQEAITVARSSFVADPTPSHALPEMVLLGDLPSSGFPLIDGYNLSYIRPGATTAIVTDDEYRAPVLAFWHRGLGRIAALTAEVDGKYSQSLNAWKDFPAFATGLGRWLLGGEPPAGVHASVERRGGEGIIRLELDPDRNRSAADTTRSATAAIVPPGNAAPQKLTLAWVGEHTLEARFPIQRAGIYLGAVEIGKGRVLPLAPLTLPYSPEYEPREDPNEGEKTLAELARVTGGTERAGLDDIFRATRLGDRQVRDLVIPLAVILLLVHLTEIAGRRLLLFITADAWLRIVRLPQWKPRRTPQETPAPVSAPEIARSPTKEEQATPVAPAKPASSPLERAKARTKNRTR